MIANTTYVRWALLILAGCNNVYGLGEVALADATLFDGPPHDPICPAAGTAAPSFDRELHQIFGASHCSQYSIARDGTAMAVCGVHATEVWAAEPDAALAAIPLPQYMSVTDARLAGDGSFAIVRGVTTTGLPETIVIRHVAKTWTAQGSFPIGQTGAILTPSAGPPYHAIYFDADAGNGGVQSLFELVGDGTTWAMQDHYPIAATLGLAAERGALSPDGLHLVSSAFVSPSYVVVYSDRATLTDRFSAARVITSAPTGIYDPYLNDNCDRLYFSALDRVFDVRQP